VRPPERLAPATALAADAVIVTPRPGATQAELLMGCLLPPADAHAEAVYTVTGKKIRSALIEPIRERMGSTYNLDVEATTLRGGSAMLKFHTEIDNQRLGGAVGALRVYWTWAANAHLGAGDEEQIQRLGLDESRDRLLQLDTSAALARGLVRAWSLGWPLRSVDDETANLARVGAAEVEAALHACARTLTVAIAGDENVVRHALNRPPPPLPRASAQSPPVASPPAAPPEALPAPVPGAPTPPAEPATSPAP
jgi:zinc protease